MTLTDADDLGSFGTDLSSNKLYIRTSPSRPIAKRLIQLDDSEMSSPPSTATFFDAESFSNTIEDETYRAVIGLNGLSSSSGKSETTVAAKADLLQQQLCEQRQSMATAELSLSELRSQLEDIKKALWLPNDPSSNSDIIKSIHTLKNERQNFDDTLYMVRLAAIICTRVVLVADIESKYQEEMSALKRQLEQTRAMGEAVIKHRNRSGPAQEPWRQSLLNAALAIGCSALGAATAVFIIRNLNTPSL